MFIVVYTGVCLENIYTCLYIQFSYGLRFEIYNKLLPRNPTWPKKTLCIAGPGIDNVDTLPMDAEMLAAAAADLLHDAPGGSGVSGDAGGKVIPMTLMIPVTPLAPMSQRMTLRSLLGTFHLALPLLMG